MVLRAAIRGTRTDSLGQFEIGNLQLGEDALVVRAVGFTPARATLPLAAGPPVELDVDRDPLPPTLERFVTEADADVPRNVALAEFEERRAMGLGRFITPLASGCHVSVFMDNVLRYANGTFLPPFDLRSLEASMIAGVEFSTTASTPARFNPLGTATCGTLVIWRQQ